MRQEKSKLLIVDDEIDICTFLQSYFGKRGFMVSTTGNGEEALKMIEASKPDLVLLDLTLDYAMSGADLLKKLREHDKDTKVIVISGNEDPIVIDKLYSLGIKGYFRKPLILERIEEIVYEQLGIEFNKILEGQELKTTSKSETICSGNVHQLSNKLNIIRGDCEAFLLDYEDGFFRNKTIDELVKLTSNTIKEAENYIGSFLENYEDGVLKQKTSDELFKTNVQIIKSIVQAVDNAMKIIDDKSRENVVSQKEVKQEKEI